MNKYRRLVFKKVNNRCWVSEDIFMAHYEIIEVDAGVYGGQFWYNDVAIGMGVISTFTEIEDACNEHFIKELSRFEQ